MVWIFLLAVGALITFFLFEKKVIHTNSVPDLINRNQKLVEKAKKQEKADEIPKIREQLVSVLGLGGLIFEFMDKASCFKKNNSQISLKKLSKKEADFLENGNLKELSEAWRWEFKEGFILFVGKQRELDCGWFGNEEKYSHPVFILKKSDSKIVFSMELQVSYDQESYWPTEYYQSFYLHKFTNPDLWTEDLILRINELRSWYDKELSKSQKKNVEEEKKRNIENFTD